VADAQRSADEMNDIRRGRRAGGPLRHTLRIELSIETAIASNQACRIRRSGNPDR
jgi:hypothetical protein